MVDASSMIYHDPSSMNKVDEPSSLMSVLVKHLGFLGVYVTSKEIKQRMCSGKTHDKGLANHYFLKTFGTFYVTSRPHYQIVVFDNFYAQYKS